ncbi:hypothetical protein F2Q69_00040871 [Brassica cretica]|uniref:Protein kinase domain-containing protein n=1 Tax=Brassica cretica TaxID=69181 RepID=A0A8S9NMX3_BRACR|nr:hypothetical protein F2Q69_00040871 [Brassica cretica]
MEKKTGAEELQTQSPLSSPASLLHLAAVNVNLREIELSHIKREISTMKLVRHPCVVRLYEPEKLLLHSQGNLKISDYGLSALQERGLSHKGYNGVVADVWSCGVILYVLSHNS